MPDEIKACPFPGCRSHLPGNEPKAEVCGESVGCPAVVCLWCDAEGPSSDTATEAIQRWNEALR